MASDLMDVRFKVEYLFDQFIMEAAQVEYSRPIKIGGNAVHLEMKVFSGPAVPTNGVKAQFEFSNDLEAWDAYATVFDTATVPPPVRIMGQVTSTSTTMSGQTFSVISSYQYARLKLTNQFAVSTTVSAAVTFMNINS